MTPGVPGAPEPRIYPRSGYFLVWYILVWNVKPNQTYNTKPKFSEHKNVVIAVFEGYFEKMGENWMSQN